MMGTYNFVWLLTHKHAYLSSINFHFILNLSLFLTAFQVLQMMLYMFLQDLVSLCVPAYTHTWCIFESKMINHLVIQLVEYYSTSEY